MKIKLYIWDTVILTLLQAGAEVFKSITTSYYKGVSGVLLFYDITNNDSFKNLENWNHEIGIHANSKISMVLVGNKSDLEKK